MNVESFIEFNEFGYEIPIEFTYPISRKADQKEVLTFVNNPSRKGIKWVFNGKEVILKDNNVSIHGLPTVNLDYVVAVYSGLNGHFSPPSNAVIYNLDGSVYKILNIPELICEKVRKRLNYLNQPNPPLSWAGSEGGLSFGGFAWRKKENGEIVNSITIEMEQGTYEIRELKVPAGHFGECLGSGLAMYAKYE